MDGRKEFVERGRRLRGFRDAIERRDLGGALLYANFQISVRAL